MITQGDSVIVWDRLRYASYPATVFAVRDDGAIAVTFDDDDLNRPILVDAESVQVADPTLWCNACGARRQEQCDCGPIAENE